MSGIAGHWWLILIVLAIVLIIWGPGKLPDVGAGMGRAIREFRKASSETHDTIINATTGSSGQSNAPAQPSPPPAAPPPPAPAPPQPSDTPHSTVSG